VNAPQAEAVVALVGPELEAGRDRLSHEGAANLAKVAAKFRQQDRAASAMSVLSYDIPADASGLLDVVLPASAKTGGWYPDDIERLKQAKIVLEALLAGGDRSRLLTAIAGLEDAEVGIASRLAPVSGGSFAPVDLKLLGHVDRILIRAASGSAELAYLENVQEAGDYARRVFDAINTRRDLATLVDVLGWDILERPSKAFSRWPEEQVRRFQLLTAVVGTFGSSDGREQAIEVLTNAPSVLTDIVNELSYAGMPESQTGEWEQNRQLVYEAAVLIGRSPQLRAVIRAIVGMGSKERKS
jgi:hypothetical protein